jgi:stringent starvation protein B
MAAAEDRVLQYLAENPGASLVDISNAIVAFGADLNTVADMVGVPRAEAQAAFAPTIDTAAQQAEAQRQAQIAEANKPKLKLKPKTSKPKLKDKHK